MPFLLDVNILVALMDSRHVHSNRAVAWIDTIAVPETVLVCRVTQMAALRLLTSPTVMKDKALSARQFWSGWGQMLSDDRFSFVEEPTGFLAVWQRITTDIPKGSNVETDAYLAAFAEAGGWSLATFDTGFRRFRTLRAEILI